MLEAIADVPHSYQKAITLYKQIAYVTLLSHVPTRHWFWYTATRRIVWHSTIVLKPVNLFSDDHLQACSEEPPGGTADECSDVT